MSVVRKLDSFVPEARDEDVFGQHACAAMREILKVGYDAWLDAELAAPSWENVDWYRMIGEMAQEREG